MDLQHHSQLPRKKEVSTMLVSPASDTNWKLDLLDWCEQRKPAARPVAFRRPKAKTSSELKSCEHDDDYLGGRPMQRSDWSWPGGRRTQRNVAESSAED
jgi:hypothetical protein